jgi:hypothetical protein
MNVMRRSHIAALWGLAFVLLTLAACGTQPELAQSPDGTLLGTPVGTSDQNATLAVIQTQQKIDADNQAAATAEIVRANAQTTLNAADATLNAAQVQQQNNADVVAAQITWTSEVIHADAQATVNSADLTQGAALTQDAIQQTQLADVATTDAQATITQQHKNDLVASTQTAIANSIATQTQAVAATSQWYADQARQREEQNGGAATPLWMGLTILIVLLVGLVLWGFWYWLKIQQSNQHILETAIEDSRYQVTNPDDQIYQWLDEVKRKLLSSEDQDHNGNTDS